MERETIAAYLSGHRALRGAVPAAVKRLAAAAQARRVAAGETLQRAGDPARRVAFVVDGLIVASLDLNSGATSAVELFGAGDYWGCLAHLSGGASFADYRALVASTTIEIPAAALMRLADEDPRVARAVALNAAERLSRLIRLHAVVSERSPRKVGAILLWLRETAGPQVPITQAVIAALSGLAVETVSRSLSAFKRRGWISYTRGRIAILRPDMLQRFVESA